MRRLGIEVPVRNIPPLDPDFLPLHRFRERFLAGARQPFHIAVERDGGAVAACHTLIRGDAASFDADVYFVERLVKTLLWVKGGFRVYLAGHSAVCGAIRRIYSQTGPRAFDVRFMSGVYERPFEVLEVDTVPPEKNVPRQLGGHIDGCRIGFDAGGSDRKVSAVINGETVYSEEVVWQPKEHADPAYHYQGIADALRAAAARLPRVDAVGVSSAGICINDRIMRASLFLRVPPERYDAEVRDIYIRAVRNVFGQVPLAVANDGDVSALAGAMLLGEANVLGLAMGTSEAGGYVDARGCVTGWLNELAFVPVDAGPAAPIDGWSGDLGCGASYFSQDAVIRLAAVAGIAPDSALSPAERLKVVQGLMERKDPRAAAVFDTVGVYLAHALAQYHDIYKFRHALLLGRVMSGSGGDRTLTRCAAVLEEEYPDLAQRIRLHLPDESFRRLGQSTAAAFLPAIR